MTDEYNKDVVFVNGEEGQSLSFGNGSCLHEKDNRTLEVTKWL